MLNGKLDKILLLLEKKPKERNLLEMVSEHVSGVNLEATTNFAIPMGNGKFQWYRFADQEGRVRKCKNEGCNLFLKYNEDKKKYEHWKFDPNTGKGGYVADKCEGIYSA